MQGAEFFVITTREKKSSKKCVCVCVCVCDACNAGDLASVPELGRSLGEGNGNPLQLFLLENSMDREA